MRKNFKTVSGKIKRWVYDENVGLSFSALWYGILVSGIMWIGLVGLGILGILTLTKGTIYSMVGLLKLVTWTIFFLGGFIAAYKAGFKGWQHGLWVGLFLGLFSVIFLLEIVPTIIAWQQVVFQWVAAVILGTSGGLVGQRVLRLRRDRKGYSFKEAKRERFGELDRGN
ncbi:MAG: hypothetical protein PWQ67_2470 [Clostridia bacterium]|nr:hypothetical protein [Clostridia bacterium]MDN5324016.1 hypothetical protein [Clostridia bacterium]